MHWLCQRKGALLCLSWQCLYLIHAGVDIHKLPNRVQFFFVVVANFMFPLAFLPFARTLEIVTSIVFWTRPMSCFRLFSCVCVVL